MRTSKIDRKKFANHLLYTNAQELVKDCERWGKNEWAAKLKEVALETAEDDMRSYVRSDVLSYVLSDVRSDVLSYVRSYVRSYVLSDVRSDVLSYVLSDVRSDVLSDVRSDVLSYVRSYVRSYVLSYVRSDVLSYMRFDVRSYVLFDVLSYVRSYMRSYVRSYVLSELVKEYINAYIYAGGKLNALKKKGLNVLTLKGIKKGGIEQSNWHTCETTHCRGGWYTVILGTAGAELEELVGTEMAASMIAYVNMGEIPDFHNMDSEAVLEDIKAWAAKEA